MFLTGDVWDDAKNDTRSHDGGGDDDDDDDDDHDDDTILSWLHCNPQRVDLFATMASENYSVATCELHR